MGQPEEATGGEGSVRAGEEPLRLPAAARRAEADLLRLKQQAGRHERGGPGGPRLSERTARVLALAQEEARRFGQEQVQTEHLLLALLAEGENPAAVLLAGRGVNLPRARGNADHLYGRGQGSPEAELALAPASERAVAQAAEETRRLGHTTLEPEHLLLVLAQEASRAGGLLGKLDVDVDALRRDVLHLVTTGKMPRPRRPAKQDEVPAFLRASTEGEPRGSVITLRATDADLEAVDRLVEAGIMRTRSEAAAWLLHAGIIANASLFDRVGGIIAGMRRLREEAQQLAREYAAVQETPELAAPEKAPPESPR